MALRADGPNPAEPADEKSELESLREQAEDLQERGLWGEEALRVNQAIVDLDPNDFTTATRLGRCVQTAGRPCEALELFDRVLAADPGEPVALELRGVAAADCQLEREVRRLESEGGLDAVRDSASSAGQSYRDLRFAVIARQAVVERDPSAVSIGALAAALAAKGELHTAEPLFRRSLELDPDPRSNADSMLAFAALLREQTRYEEAVAACEQVLAGLPEDVRALTLATGLLGDLAETERSHERLVEANGYADRIWAQGIRDDSVDALYDRMKRIYARI
jgi:tetratricopeptide (TPR) repeat protein